MIRQFRAASLLLAASLALSAPVAAQNQDGPLNRYGNPLTHRPRPTSAQISAEDLRTRLYIFAADSMEGRQTGRIGNMKGTDYIAAELRRMGVEPGGDNGTYFQRLPYVQRKFSDRSTLTVGSRALRFSTDFAPVPGARAPKAIENVQVIYGGVEGDPTRQITPAQAAGKFVVMSVAAAAPAAAGGGRAGGAGAPVAVSAARYPDAVAVATIDLDALTAAQRAAINNPAATNAGGRGAGPGAGDVIVTTNRGGVVVLRDGRIVSGSLGEGQSLVDVQAALADQRRNDAITAAGTALRRDSLAATARALAAAGRKTGTFTFFNETLTLDSVQIATLSAAAAGRGAGAGGGGGGGGAGGAAGRGGAPAAPATPPAPVAQIRITRDAAQALLGAAAEGLQPGFVGLNVTARLDFQEVQTDWGRNVVGIIRGSDPALRGQFVALGAHNDHVGFTTPVDHDSLKAFNNELMKRQMAVVQGDLRAISAQDRAAIRVNMDSIRRMFPQKRLDSINNGADDDGSGSMALLEIAEAIQGMATKPKRSTVFVWHTGEESGLVGSAYYANNPTVPLDSVVAQINMDMIGRGRAEDMVGGGPTYLGSVGSKRLSGELDAVMHAVNARQPTPLRIDYRFDDPTLGLSIDGKPASWPGYNNIYGRSDHANYANKCIPIVFFFTGLHMDYHQRTDEPQYIDYPHYSMVVSFIRDLATEVGNGGRRPMLDRPCVRR